MAGRAGETPPAGFPHRLNHLFATVRPPDTSREFTNAEVAQATGISATYIGYLRKGVRDNPSVETLRSLARFFDIRPSYLVDDEPDRDDGVNDARRRLAEAMQKPGITRLAMRAAEADLSVAALDAITAMIDEVEKLERAARRRADGGTSPH